MASKSKKQSIIRKKAATMKPFIRKDGLPQARRCVSQRASNLDETCPMKLVIYLSSTNHWYLKSHDSNLQHQYHPELDLKASLLSQKDLSEKELTLLNILYDVNVAPSTISKILSTLMDQDVGTLVPKTIFNITQKTRNLLDVANEILPTCSDAEKTLKLLEL
jgi:predicted transcriptional regulator